MSNSKNRHQISDYDPKFSTRRVRKANAAMADRKATKHKINPQNVLRNEEVNE